MRASHYPRYRFDSFLEQALAALLLGFLLFFLTAGAALSAYQVIHAGAVFPGVRVAGVDLGGMNQSAAAAAVTGQLSFPQNGKILFRDGTQVWLVSPAEIGLFFDPQVSVARAYAVGRSGSLFERIRQQIDARSYGVDLSPAFLYDQRAAYRYLATLASQIDRPMIEASLDLRGTEVVVQPGQVGRRVDIDATLSQLTAQLLSLTDGVVPLVIVETKPLIMDANQQAEQARAILSRPFTLSLPSGEPDRDQNGPWVIQPDTLAGMLSIERITENGGGSFRVGINPTLMRAYLGSLVSNVDVWPQNARFIFNDDTRQLDVLEKSVAGRSLDVEATLKAVNEAVTGGKHEIDLAFNRVKPQVEDTATAESLGITEAVFVETSWYYGSSASRVQNIQAAAARFHGLLVAPGETFSMATALGDISLDNGYAEAMIILGGKTIKGVGGGVCQVSTTLFRTAFFAGYPILERHAHAYRVYYYEKVGGNRIDPSLAGLDATVFVPLVDFKFRNDTPYWLLMETYVNPQTSSITWKFYSTKDGRDVQWDTTGPVNIVDPPDPEYVENPDLAQGEIKQVDWQAEGADVTVNRTVLRNGSIYLQDTFTTHYLPWADVFEYGPGTELPDQGGGDEEE